MNIDIYTKIINLVSDTIGQEELIEKLNECFNNSSDDILLRMHDELPQNILKVIVHNFDKINLNRDSKEHIIYRYYGNLFNENIEIRTLDLLDIIEAYSKYKFIALESVIIDQLKIRNFTNEQIQLISKNFSTKETNKQIFNYNVINKVNEGTQINKETIEELIKLDSFNALNIILDKECISNDALNIFKEPHSGEGNRKKKLELFHKARKIIKN